MSNQRTLILYMFIVVLTSLLSKITKRHRSIIVGDNHIYEVYNNFGRVVISFSPMIILAGTRLNTGADYIQYRWNFERLLSSGNMIEEIKNSREPFYVFTEFFVVKFLKGSYTTWVFFISLMTIVVLLYAIIKIDHKIDLSTFSLIFGLYLYFHMFNYVRQFFALSLITLAISFLLSDKSKKFIVFIILATLYHQSSIIFLLIYFVYKKKKIIFGKKYHFFVIFSPLFISGMALLLKYVPFFSIYYQRYFGKSFRFGFGWAIDLIPALLMYVIVATEKHKNNTDVKINFLSEIALLIIPMRALSYYSYAAGRLFIDFALFMTIAFSNVMSKDVCNKRFLKFIIEIVTFIYFILSFYIWNNSEVFPYCSTINT